MVITIRLAVVMLLFFLSRIAFWLFNLRYFNDLGTGELFRIFLRGVLFDFSAVMAINLPVIVLCFLPFKFRYSNAYLGIVNTLFYSFNAIGLMANFVDSVYFRFTLKRMTWDIFRYLEVGGDFNTLIPQFMKDFWPVALTWLGFTALLIWVCTRMKTSLPANKGKGNQQSYYVSQSFLFILAILISVIGIRGGWHKRTINLHTPARYVTAKYIPLLTNTPFSIIKSYKEDPIVRKTWFSSEKELAEIYTPYHPATTDTLQPLNVMVIVMESFSKEHIGALNRDLGNGAYEGYTPFLDSLIGHSLTFQAYANGKTSIQGIPAILSGIPCLMDQPMLQSSYAANKMPGLAGLLKRCGYQTAFFHGGTNGIMDYETYMPEIGFRNYFGRTEYGNDNDFDGKWGIRDEEFMQFMAQKTNAMRQPFMVAFFSLSSHHPYELPGKYAHQFNKGNLPIQQVVQYSDYSLARFFHTIRHENWFFNTLFVITADHTSEGYYAYYNTHAGQFAIPLIFYKPGSDLHGKSSKIAQQTDIMPTILGYLGYNRPFLAFGNNLLDKRSEGFSVNYVGGMYTLIRGGYSLESDGTRTTAFFNLKKDPLQQHNLAGKGEKSQKEQELFLKAYLQQYNNRMIENRLIVE